MRPHRETWRAARMALRAAVALLGCATAAAAHGREGNVFTPYAALNLIMDTNLFRLPADVPPATQTGRSERGDVINSNQVGLRGDRWVGRQRLSFDVNFNQTRYRTYGYLNADLFNGAGTWGWQLDHDFSGEIGTVRTQSLTGFSDVRSSARNISTVTVNRATLNYNLQPSWRLISGLYETTLDNSSAERTAGNFKTDALEAGITYMPATGNRLTLRARGTRAVYPTEQNFLGVKVNNDYTQYDLETEVYWQISGQSQLSFLLADSRRHYPDLPQRDFNGPAGRAIWDWQASGKTLLELSWRREIGAFQDITDNYIVTDTLATNATYQASAKTQLQGRLYTISRRFLGDPGFVLANTTRRIDHVKGASLTLNYDAARALRLSATLQRELRNSNTAGFNYGDTSATLSMQFNW
jgi:exopolysaccharide biosynthesis operon protein EpsL